MAPGLVPADCQVVQQHIATLRVVPQQGVGRQLLPVVQAQRLVAPGGHQLLHGGQGLALHPGKRVAEVLVIDVMEPVQPQFSQGKSVMLCVHSIPMS